MQGPFTDYWLRRPRGLRRAGASDLAQLLSRRPPASLVTQDPPALGAIKLFLLGSYGPGGSV